MALTNTSEQYGTVSFALHWIMAIMIITLLFVGFNMEDAPKHLKPVIYGGHKATGVLVLILACCRIIWRFISPPPALPQSTHAWQQILSKITVGFLYTSMLVMPMSGIAMNIFAGRSIKVFNLFTIQATENKIPEIVELGDSMHHIFALVLSTLILLHIAGGLYHWLINRDQVLQRMLRRSK